jgi:hypothetical protein
MQQAHQVGDPQSAVADHAGASEDNLAVARELECGGARGLASSDCASAMRAAKEPGRIFDDFTICIFTVDRLRAALASRWLVQPPEWPPCPSTDPGFAIGDFMVGSSLCVWTERSTR